MTLPDVPARDWEAWAKDHDAIVLDVRRPDEWALGTLPGATLMTMSQLPSRLQELPKDRAILCVCRSGDRSSRVAAYLGYNGYENVANMSGGMKALGMQR